MLLSFIENNIKLEACSIFINNFFPLKEWCISFNKHHSSYISKTNKERNNVKQNNENKQKN